jgi:acetolactate synthase-1/2/3 large subunit
MAKMTGGRFIAETLKGYGVTHVFYVEAIARRALVEMEELGIARVLTHSEKAAAYMADGYARIGRKPGVCMAQSVGAANLAAGLQDAWLGRSPVLAITGRKPAIARYRNAYQEIDHFPMFDPVTKFNVCVDTVEQLPYLLPQAFREATTGSPRPVHLELMGYEGDTICAAEADLEVVVEESFRHCPALRPEPEPEAVKRSVEALLAAKRPLIVIGGGVRISDAGEEVRLLAERLTIPVANSVDGKGQIPDRHPLHVGVIGTYSQQCANQVLAEADTIMFIGSNTGDQITNNWTLPQPAAQIIQIDIDPAEPGRNFPGAIGVVGDARSTLRRMNTFLDCAADVRSRGWADHVRTIVDSWRKETKLIKSSDNIPILPERLCAEIEAALPSDGILVSDTGYNAIWSATIVDLNSAAQSYLRAAGSLGWAFPASLGVKCAAPDRPVVCLTGDGGFWYHLSELETACRWRINTVTVVNNNSVLAQCRRGIDRSYGTRSGKKADMYRFNDTDFAQLARHLGCTGIRVSEPSRLREALLEALHMDGPVVVDVITDGEHPAPWTQPAKEAVKLN